MPEKSNPAIIAPPSPLQRGSDNVIGINPTTVQIVPNKIGSTLDAQASEIACFRCMPAF